MNDLTIKATTGGDFTIGSIAFAPQNARRVEPVTGIGAGQVLAGSISAASIRAATTDLDIGGARKALFEGKRVAREGWNGKGMHLELQVPDAHSKMTRPYVYLFTADGHRVPWTVSQTDLLATDWEIVS